MQKRKYKQAVGILNVFFWLMANHFGMEYIDSYVKLKEAFLSAESKAEIGNIEIHKLEFDSLSYDVLPGSCDYYCKSHDLSFKDCFSFYNDIGTIKDNVQIKDISVEENRKFNYYILKPRGEGKSRKITFLFHGFNEKYWDKYLPWAEAICENTQSAVVLFPIAFHMQRAPLYWSEKREMFELSEKRKKKYPNIINSTLSNVAISMRLHSMPQRFIWSGLQTYYDVIRFVEECKNGGHELIDKDFKMDIFAYSIGGLLAEILKLSDYKGFFSDTKICLFCSGAVFNRLSPVSKFILDSEANVALYSFLVEHFDRFLKKDVHLSHYINNHVEGKVFRSMLDYQKMIDFREELLRKTEKQTYAISLKKDYVIPSFEIMNTLKGAYRNINIAVDELDFDHAYTHETPFPVNKKETEKINQNFKMVFDKVCGFFNAWEMWAGLLPDCI